MKVLSKFRVGMILALICSLMVSMVAAEEASVTDLPAEGWTTGIQIQNVGSTDATIELTGYDRTSGTAAAPATNQIAPGASANFTDYPTGSAEFDGSGVVSADQPIVAIVNVNNAPAGGLAAGQYQGTDGGSVATTLSFPLVKNAIGPVGAEKCTIFYIQNAGTAATTINASFSDPANSTADAANIAPGQTWLLDPAVAGVDSATFYALTVSASEPLAGTVLEYLCADNTLLQATRGFTPDDYSSELLSPIFKRDFRGRSNGLQVQNVSAAAADITVEFTCTALSDAATCGLGDTRTYVASDVPAGESATFFRNAVIVGGVTTTVPDAEALPVGALASAKVTAVEAGTATPANIVAINNESNFDGSRVKATTYSALPVAAASTSVGVPLTKEMFGPRVQATGIQIQNASETDAATVDVTYNMNGGLATCQGTFVATGISIPAGGSVTLFRTSAAGSQLPGGGQWGANGAPQVGCFGSVVIDVTSANTSVVAIVQEADYSATPATHQDNKNYEGFATQ